MTCKQPAFFFHGIGNFFGTFPFFLKAEIRVTVKPVNLVLIKVIRSCFIALIRTVTKDAIVSGERYNTLCSSVGKIRMLLNETVDQWNHVIVTN